MLFDINSRVCYMPSMGGGGAAGGDNSDGSDSSGGNTGGMGSGGSSSGNSGGGGDGGLGALGLGGYGSNTGQIDGTGFTGFDGDGNEVGNSSGYVDGWASTVKDFVETQVNTNVSINTNLDGSVDFYGDVSGWGFLNDKTGFVGVDGATYSGGAISAGLTSVFGMSVQMSMTIESLSSVAIGILMGAPLTALAPMAKALEVQGAISHEVSKDIQAVGLVGSFMQGTISNMQALSSISTAKSYGAISGMQAAVLGGLTAYSQYNATMALSSNMTSLGFSPSISSMTDFGFSNGSDGDLYLGGVKVTASNYQSVTQEFVNWYVLNNKYDEDEFDTFDKMAGGLYFNNYVAGGDMWNPMNIVGKNLLASVGDKLEYNNFAKRSILGSENLTNYI